MPFRPSDPAPQRRRLRLGAAACAMGLGLGVAIGGVAFAFWLGTAGSGSNYAESSAQTLPAGATPTASVTPAAGQTVTLTFAQDSSSGGTALTAYTVTRYASGSSTGSAISGSCSITAGLVTCTDGPGTGAWQYGDAPLINGSNWVGASSAKSTAVVVQALTTTTVAATASVVVNTAVQPTATLANATATPAPGGSISFSVFGPQASAPTTCTGTGWSTVGSAVGVTANGTYPASASYTPTAAGTYWWYASYGGDTNNAASNSGCAVSSTVVHLAVTPASLPSATVYVAYSQAISASGGTSPYAFTESGALPTGITLSTGGTLAGTISAANQPGSYPITITATDAHGLTGTVSDTLTVVAPTISLAALTNPTGETADTTSVSASGGQAPYTYAKTSGSLPTGLSFSSAGAFSGSPTVEGTFTFTLTATDSHGYTGSRSYTLTPGAPNFVFSPTAVPSVTVYVAYSQALSTSGGTGPYGYTETGALPSGITLSTGGTLAGTISAAGQPGSYPITVTATDADGFSGTTTYTLTVLAPTITLSALSNPTGETADAASVSASGGQAAYTYAKTSGSLPTGLSFSSAGAFSGSPSAAGSFTFTITATDSHGYTGSQSYTLIPLAPTFTVSPASLPSATVYVAYSQAFTTSGGLSSYTYTETGALPSGITLSTGGTLAGTISAANQPGSYPITVTATDADGFSGTTTYTLTVLAPTITLTPTTLPNGALGYSQQVTATATGNASDTFTYAITSGALPNGFTMTTGGLIKAGITLTLGTFHFTVTATDANGYTGSRAYTITVLL